MKTRACKPVCARRREGKIKTTRSLAVGTLVAAVLVTAGVAPSLADSFTVKVSEDELHWSPASRDITRDDRIVWKNPVSRSQPHTVTAYGGNWSKNVTLFPGDATAKTFRSTGTYKFRCTFHSTLSGGQCSRMCGVIRVTAP